MRRRMPAIFHGGRLWKEKEAEGEEGGVGAAFVTPPSLASVLWKKSASEAVGGTEKHERHRVVVVVVVFLFRGLESIRSGSSLLLLRFRHRCPPPSVVEAEERKHTGNDRGSVEEAAKSGREGERRRRRT